VQQETRIVDPETRKELRSGLVGEVWTSGATNSTGYWNRFELSQEVFAARISDGPAAKYMRTGDLGFLVGTGMSAQLYIVGRLKDLIIVDGRNLYPEDVERTVERKHSEVRPGCCAAFSVLFEGTENLIVLAEVDLRRALNARSSDSPDGLASDLIKRITSTVAEEHEARVQEVVLVSTGGVLKTTSGKLQRSACRAAFVAGTLPRLSRFGN
jgi:acyl-CoA synthetase (AMP-forming)/AMP-acid ligase II